LAQWLLGQGADINAVDTRGMSALMTAVKRKDERTIKWLVEAGADPDRANREGMSARRLAEVRGPKRISTLLGYFAEERSSCSRHQRGNLMM
jgi:ankyrin repeat protein